MAPTDSDANCLASSTIERRTSPRAFGPPGPPVHAVSRPKVSTLDRPTVSTHLRASPRGLAAGRTRESLTHAPPGASGNPQWRQFDLFRPSPRSASAPSPTAAARRGRTGAPGVPAIPPWRSRRCTRVEAGSNRGQRRRPRRDTTSTAQPANTFREFGLDPASSAAPFGELVTIL